MAPIFIKVDSWLLESKNLNNSELKNSYFTLIFIYKSKKLRPLFDQLISRPGQSQGLLYNHCCNSFIDLVFMSLTLFLPWLYGAVKSKQFMMGYQNHNIGSKA